MNWLLIVVVVLWAFYIVRGYKKGMLKMLYSLVSWIAILILVTMATPYMTEFLTANTSIEQNIHKTCKDKLKNLVTGESASPNEGTDAGGTSSQSSNKALLDALGLKIPEELLESIVGDDNLADSFFESTGLYEQAATEITAFAMKGISFILCLIVAVIISRIIYGMISIVEAAPVVGMLNRLFGIIIGSIKGLCIVWTVFAIVAMNAMTQTGMMMTEYIYESPFLQWIYENNFVLTILLRFL